MLNPVSVNYHHILNNVDRNNLGGFKQLTQEERRIVKTALENLKYGESTIRLNKNIIQKLCNPTDYTPGPFNSFIKGISRFVMTCLGKEYIDSETLLEVAEQKKQETDLWKKLLNPTSSNNEIYRLMRANNITPESSLFVNNPASKEPTKFAENFQKAHNQTVEVFWREQKESYDVKPSIEKLLLSWNKNKKDKIKGEANNNEILYTLIQSTNDFDDQTVELFFEEVGIKSPVDYLHKNKKDTALFELLRTIRHDLFIKLHPSPYF